jgi:hypothetical protein
LGKQYPTTHFSCSVHDINSMNESRYAKPEHPFMM